MVSPALRQGAKERGGYSASYVYRYLESQSCLFFVATRFNIERNFSSRLSLHIFKPSDPPSSFEASA